MFFFYLNTVTSNWVKKVFQSYFPNFKRLNLANFSNVIVTILYFLAFCLPFVESKEEQLETDLNRNKVSRDSKNKYVHVRIMNIYEIKLSFGIVCNGFEY